MNSTEWPLQSEIELFAVNLNMNVTKFIENLFSSTYWNDCSIGKIKNARLFCENVTIIVALSKLWAIVIYTSQTTKTNYIFASMVAFNFSFEDLPTSLMKKNWQAYCILRTRLSIKQLLLMQMLNDCWMWFFSSKSLMTPRKFWFIIIFDRKWQNCLSLKGSSEIRII